MFEKRMEVLNWYRNIKNKLLIFEQKNFYYAKKWNRKGDKLVKIFGNPNAPFMLKARREKILYFTF